MSHAMAHKAGIGAHGLWSVARGLARGLNDRGEYMRFMDLADSPRESDLDGRGNLSQRALMAFVEWFLRIESDQIRFMTALFDLENLTVRVERFVAMNTALPPASATLLKAVIMRGEVRRGEVPEIIGLPERSARRALGALEKRGLLKSVSPKGSVWFNVTQEAAEALFPTLFLPTDSQA